MSFRSFLAVLLALAGSAPLHAQCTLQLSDEGIVRMASGATRQLTWNAVPGATSYRVEQVTEGLNEPSGPDFTFGGAYTEAQNGEGQGNFTSIEVRHTVLYKIRFRYIVTALNRGDAAFQPCSDDVLYVVEPDQELASIAATRYIPLAGKTPGANGANFATTLMLSATGLKGNPDDPGTAKIYQGRVYFRPVGTEASANDPSIAYAIDGDETLVLEDVMQQLGASGVGTLEVVPRIGFPSPMVEAIVENRQGDGQKTGVRVPAAWGRDLLEPRQAVLVPIRNMTDARLSLGVRSLGGPGSLILQHRKANGSVVETVQRFSAGNTTELFPLQQLFTSPLEQGDRVQVGYFSFDLRGAEDTRFPGAKGVLLFLTETGNHFNNPNVVYLPSIAGRWENGFDRFVVR